MRRSALVVLLVSHVAYAQPKDDVTKVFASGVDAYRLGKFDEAKTLLEKARALDPKLPGPHRFLAAVAQAQSRFTDCMKDAYKALELNPRSSETADTRKLYESCRVSAGRMGAREDLGESGAISVTTNVPGATVKINGLTYGGTPLAPRPITSGTLELEIEKHGWKPFKKEVNALPGIVTDLDIELEVDPDAPPLDDLGIEKVEPIKVGYLMIPTESGEILVDEAPIETKGERIELSPGTHVVELRQPGKDPWRRRVRISAGQKTTVSPMFVDTDVRAKTERTGLYIVGAGAAVLAGGFVASMIARGAADEARDIVRTERGRDPSRPLSETATIAPVRTREDLEDARDRHSRFSLISNALYATGIVTVGVGAYFLVKGARQRRDAPPPFAIAPVQGGAVIAKELSW